MARAKRKTSARPSGPRRKETEAPAKGQSRAVRPAWEGHLRLSLVTCPVTLYTATENTADVHFHLINPETNNRIHLQTVDAVTGEAVERSGLVRGFEVAKNKYVLFDKDELDAVKLESTRVVDITEFVDAASIDRIYWDQPYYLAPSGRTGIEAYAVIRAAMAQRRKVALGRLVLHQRERLCALEPRDGGMLLTTLHAHDQIRSTAGVFGRDLPKPDPRMLEIAERIIEQQAAAFDPSRFVDRYEDALRELIARKAKGETVVSAEAAEPEEKVVDLMAALQRSLEGGGGPPRDKADRYLAARGRQAKAPKRKRTPRRRAA
ncbi:MAG: Ku protein [Reyranellaceae bacterium]